VTRCFHTFNLVEEINCLWVHFLHLHDCLQFGLIGQTIEELLGVGTRISPQIIEDFALINELHFIEIIVDRSWDFEFTSH